MYIRRKVYSVFEDEDGYERLFSTTDFDYDEYGDAYLNDRYFSEAAYEALKGNAQFQKLKAAAASSGDPKTRHKLLQMIQDWDSKHAAEIENYKLNKAGRIGKAGKQKIHERVAAMEEGLQGPAKRKITKAMRKQAEEAVNRTSGIASGALHEVGRHVTNNEKEILAERFNKALSKNPAIEKAADEKLAKMAKEQAAAERLAKLKGLGKDAWKFMGEHKLATAGLALAGTGAGAAYYAHNKK